MQLEPDGRILRLCEYRVDGLAGEDAVEVSSRDGVPHEPVLDDVARVVLVLLVDDDPVQEPPDLRLRMAADRPARQRHVVALLVRADRFVQQPPVLVENVRPLRRD